MEQPRFIDADDGVQVYPGAIYEAPTGDIGSDCFGNAWREVVSVVREGYDWIVSPGGYVWNTWGCEVTITPPVLPETFEVVVGDSEGNGEIVAHRLSKEDALEMAKRISGEE